MTEKEQLQLFEVWVREHKAVFFKIIRAYAPDVMDQDDLLQDILVQVWRSIPSFRGESMATTWLYRIALNTALTWTRKERKYLDTGRIMEAAHILSEDGTPDARLGWLYRQIHEMDAIDRSIALLLLEGFSYKEMAVIVGISETNIGVKINRIKKRLIAKAEKHERYGI